MAPSFRRFGLLAVASLSLVWACSSEPLTSPASLQAPAASQKDLLGGLLGGVTGLVTGNGLQRKVPLAAPITVAKTIGAAGGTLEIPSAGVTVTVPAGALASNTLITMTARAGSMVAYDFAPHGIVFAKPLAFSQKLSGTNATILSAPFLKLGYYSNPNMLGAVTATVNELLVGVINVVNWSFNGQIHHFSGYVILCANDN